MRDDRRKVLVIGAGAAGILAAWRAASLGAQVILLEKNDRIGIKILISGGGRCNITHDGPLEDLIRAFRPNEARFIRPSCYRFTNRDILEMLTRRGLEVMTRPDGRVFPLHGTAKDVVAVLKGYLDEAGVQVRLNAGVTSIESDGEGISCVRVGDELIPSRHVIVAVGGSSYPGSGTTGDGWSWVRNLGHTIVKVRAALAPIFLTAAPPAGWSGVALRDCILKARQNGSAVRPGGAKSGTEFVRWRGDLLFTHRGVSGPTVLGISREVAERRPSGPVSLEVDMLPDEPHESVTARLVQWVNDHPKRALGGCLEALVPSKLIERILSDAGIDREVTGAHLRQKDRNRLVETLKGWTIGWVEHVPLEKGEVVAGGVGLDEVDPQTMRSKIVRGLYLCGEMLDIAGPVGGYNLQAAFATGYVAGETAATDARVEH